MAYNVSRSSGINKTVEVEIKYQDISAEATTYVFEAFPIPLTAQVVNVGLVVDEEFDGGATTELTAQVGVTGDDPDGYILASSVHADATPVVKAFLNGAYGNFSVDAANDTIDVLFTATGANTSVLTQGKLRVIVNYLDIS